MVETILLFAIGLHQECSNDHMQWEYSKKTAGTSVPLWQLGLPKQQMMGMIPC